MTISWFICMSWYFSLFFTCIHFLFRCLPKNSGSENIFFLHFFSPGNLSNSGQWFSILFNNNCMCFLDKLQIEPKKFEVKENRFTILEPQPPPTAEFLLKLPRFKLQNRDSSSAGLVFSPMHAQTGLPLKSLSLLSYLTGLIQACLLLPLLTTAPLCLKGVKCF